MKNHIQVVAALHLALGAMSVLAALIVFGSLGLAGGIVIAQGEEQAAGILGIIALALLGLPGILGGWGLFTGRSWARPLVLVLGVLALFNVPIGTAVGVYTLWALLHHPEAVPPLAPPVQTAFPARPLNP